MPGVTGLILISLLALAVNTHVNLPQLQTPSAPPWLAHSHPCSTDTAQSSA